MFLNWASVLAALNSEIKKIEEETVGDAKIKSLRLGQYGDCQWKNHYDSYCFHKIQLSENSGLVTSVRSASYAFQLYFDDLINYGCYSYTETNWYATKFIHTQE
jgi:hypothetical protein